MYWYYSQNCIQDGFLQHLLDIIDLGNGGLKNLSYFLYKKSMLFCNLHIGVK